MKTVIVLWAIACLSLYGREYKAVFDCSSNDARYISSRIFLVEKTLQLIEQRGDSAVFAITLHGGCVPMVSKNMGDIVDNDDLPLLQKAQEILRRLHEQKKVETIACAMSLNANGIDPDEVVPFVRISEDSFIDTIGYQNDGYALMLFQ